MAQQRPSSIFLQPSFCPIPNASTARAQFPSAHARRWARILRTRKHAAAAPEQHLPATIFLPNPKRIDRASPVPVSPCSKMGKNIEGKVRRDKTGLG
ncbi:hypothetical protein [Roseimaritima ulvae]|uniref:hypothetical protein n=1 Tax=Roseimaritima ulvae TaxID=980254 RepID=UPI00138FC0C0|nr:hypothetical protein [Roseimaritima ulvae]